jgi:hypothetical protein
MTLEGNITFTVEKREALRAAIVQADRDGVKVFTFEDRDMRVSYAKYLLEYLDDNLQPTRGKNDPTLTAVPGDC